MMEVKYVRDDGAAEDSRCSGIHSFYAFWHAVSFVSISVDHGIIGSEAELIATQMKKEPSSVYGGRLFRLQKTRLFIKYH